MSINPYRLHNGDVIEEVNINELTPEHLDILGVSNIDELRDEGIAKIKFIRRKYRRRTIINDTLFEQFVNEYNYTGDKRPPPIRRFIRQRNINLNNGPYKDLIKDEEIEDEYVNVELINNNVGGKRRKKRKSRKKRTHKKRTLKKRKGKK